MSQSPITEFFADAPIITPAKMQTAGRPQLPPQIKTAWCTFLCEHLDQAALAPILADCRLLYYVFGRSGKVPIYQYRDQCLLVLLTVGAPVAAAVVEELHYLGIENVVAFGTAGLLDAGIAPDTLILLEQAIRDEGTSYHYLPPALMVATDQDLTNVLEKYLAKFAVVQRGISWTTDALFRETVARTAKRRAQGAIVVEMEAAAFAAAAQKLGMRFAEFVFASDTLAEPATWSWVTQTTADERRSCKVALLQTFLTAGPEIKLPKKQ